MPPEVVQALPDGGDALAELGQADVVGSRAGGHEAATIADRPPGGESRRASSPARVDEGGRDDLLFLADERSERPRENLEALFLMGMDVRARRVAAGSEIEMNLRELATGFDRSPDELNPLPGGRLEGEAGPRVSPLRRLLFGEDDMVEQGAKAEVENG